MYSKEEAQTRLKEAEAEYNEIINKEKELKQDKKITIRYIQMLKKIIREEEEKRQQYSSTKGLNKWKKQKKNLKKQFN